MDEIKLSGKEVKYLNNFVNKGRQIVREVTRARILLLLNQKRGNAIIAQILSIDKSTVWRTKKRYLESGLQCALTDKPRSGQPKKYTEKHKAEIIATACTKSPDGTKRWSIRLLTKKLRKKEGLETINRETVRLVLKKTKQSPG